MRLASEGEMDARHDDRPLGTYVLLTAAFNLGAWGLGALLGGRRRMPLGDVLLLGAATHEASRVIAKERVTRTIRKPFTEVKADGHEEPRPQGPRRALGELLTCPYCLAPWIALALSTSYLLAPRTTRTYGTVLAIATVSDFLQRGSSLLNETRAEIASRAAPSSH